MKYYSITKEDISRLKNTADRFYSKREDLDSKLISWESFTTDWLWFELPESLLDEEGWKKHRCHWKNSINDLFIELERPCELFVVRNRGVQLMINKLASHKYISDRIRSYSNNTKNTITGCKERVISNPESKKLLKKITRMFESFSYQAIGAIDDSRLPADLKIEWKRTFKKNLPKDEE